MDSVVVEVVVVVDQNRFKTALLFFLAQQLKLVCALSGKKKKPSLLEKVMATLPGSHINHCEERWAPKVCQTIS